MNGRVNREVLEELAKFSGWWAEKKGERYVVETPQRMSDHSPRHHLCNFETYLSSKHGVSTPTRFLQNDYKSILSVYIEYYDNDNKVLEDYIHMNKILEVVGKEFEEGCK